MSAVEALTRLSALEAPFFTTADASVRLDLSRSAASHVLARLAQAGAVLRLKPGTWALPGRLDRLVLPEALAAPFPAYVSLQSALYHHGMVSQIPTVLYAVSPARTGRFDTPLGPVSLHHVSPRFFFGFERLRHDGPCLAAPEKALLDALYLAPARSGLFRSLPELELPSSFDGRLARRWAARIPSPRTRTLVLRRLAAFLDSL